MDPADVLTLLASSIYRSLLCVLEVLLDEQAGGQRARTAGCVPLSRWLQQAPAQALETLRPPAPALSLSLATCSYITF